MASITIQKEFKDRHDLDNWVRGHCGVKAENNKEHTLEISAEEMAKLALSENDTVFGVKIKKAEVEKKNI